MMGVGSLSSASLASSSSLSPLARPFTIDRSAARHNLNSKAHLIEASSTATSCSSESCVFPTSYISDIPSMSHFDVQSGPNAELLSTFTPSLQLPAPYTSSVNQVSSWKNGSFSFSGCSDSVITSLLETGPYYSQYAVPAVVEDGAQVVSNGLDFDLLSSSHASMPTRPSKAGDAPAGWGGYWNGVCGVPDRCIGSDAFTGQKEVNISSFSAYNYMNSGIQATEGVDIVDESVIPPDKRYPVTDVKEAFTPCLNEECKLSTNFGSATLSETFLPFVSPPYDLSNFNLDEAFESSDISSHALGKPPSFDNNCLEKCSSINYEEIPRFYIPNMHEPYHPVELNKEKELDKNCVSTDPGKYSMFVGASKADETYTPNHTSSISMLDHVVREKHEPLVVRRNCSENSQDSNNAVNFQKSDDLDYLNPVVDSPCWKGSVSYFSQFDDSEFAHSQLHNKMLETCSGVIMPERSLTTEVSMGEFIQNNVPYKDEHVQKCLSSLLEEQLVIKCSSGDHISSVSKGTGFDSQKILDFESECTESCGYDAIIARSAGMDDVSRYDPTRLHVTGLDSCLHLSDIAHVKSFRPGGEYLAPEVNVNIFVNAMNNLSELLLVHCSANVNVLNKRDQSTLKQVIRNLDTCLAKNTEQVSTGEESLTCRQSIFHGGENPLNVDADHPQEEPKVMTYIADGTMHRPSGGEDDGNDVKICNTVKEIKKILEKHYQREKANDPQSRLFKNLWLETEATLCYTNCEARLNGMRIETGQQKFHDAERNIIAGAKEQSAPSFIQKYDRLVDSNDGEVSMMERFRILKQRDERANYNTKVQKQPSDGGNLSFAVICTGDVLESHTSKSTGNGLHVGWWDGSSSSE